MRRFRLAVYLSLMCVHTLFDRDLSSNRIKFVVPGSLAHLAHLSEV